MLRVKSDPGADAVYIYLSDKLCVSGKDLDTERRIDYAEDGTPIGVELLCVSHGVNVDDLPQSDEIASVLEGLGIKVFA